MTGGREWIPRSDAQRIAQRLRERRRALGLTQAELAARAGVARSKFVPWDDVLRRKPADWMALDDDYLHWPTWCREQLVRTDEALGISAPHVLDELKTKLLLLHEPQAQ